MAKGSLPRYVINLEELASLFPLKADNTLHSDKQKQRCKGIYIYAESGSIYTEKWKINRDIIIIGIKIACSYENNYFMDNLDISVIKDKVETKFFTNIYMKDFVDYKHFVCQRKIQSGSELVITYRNASGESKDIWFDIDYISK